MVGIVKSESDQGGTVQTPDQEVDAYLPLAVAKERFGDVNVKHSSGSRESEKVELHQLIVQVRSNEEVEATAAAVRVMLERFHKKVDYKIDVPLALLRFEKNMIRRGILTKEKSQRIRRKVDREVDAALVFAEESAYPDRRGLHDHVFKKRNGIQ